MKGDQAARGAWYKDLASVRAITPNEIRERENMPPLPNGDVVGPPVQERVTETGQLEPNGSLTPLPKAPNELPAPTTATANGNGAAAVH
jgi:hypothetical protein